MNEGVDKVSLLIESFRGTEVYPIISDRANDLGISQADERPEMSFNEIQKSVQEQKSKSIGNWQAVAQRNDDKKIAQKLEQEREEKEELQKREMQRKKAKELAERRKQYAQNCRKKVQKKGVQNHFEREEEVKEEPKASKLSSFRNSLRAMRSKFLGRKPENNHAEDKKVNDGRWNIQKQAYDHVHREMTPSEAEEELKQIEYDSIVYVEHEDNSRMIDMSASVEERLAKRQFASESRSDADMPTVYNPSYDEELDTPHRKKREALELLKRKKAIQQEQRLRMKEERLKKLAYKS